MADSIETWLLGHSPIKRSTTFSVGDMIGEWKLLAMIGRGGSGEVWRAKEERTGRIAAIKVLSRDDEKSRSRFRRGIDFVTAHSADLECVAHCYGCGEERGSLYAIFEELVPLELPEDEGHIAKLMIRLCAAVGKLHELQVVHRDLKPSNLMVRPGDDSKDPHPVLIDFDLIKRIGKEAAAIGENVSVVDGRAVGVGTLGFSAPEQFLKSEATVAVDIHALGMIANACFRGELPGPWEEIVRRSTSSVPMLRYGDTAELAKAIRGRHRTRAVIAGVVAALAAFTAAAATLMFVGRGGKSADTVAQDDEPKPVIFGAEVAYMLTRDVNEEEWEPSKGIREYFRTPELEWTRCGNGTRSWAVETNSTDKSVFVFSFASDKGVADSRLRAQIEGPCRVNFEYQYMSYGGGFVVYVDGRIAHSRCEKTGTDVPWSNASIEVPSGSHTIQFVYVHSGTGYLVPFNGVKLRNLRIDK